MACHPPAISSEALRRGAVLRALLDVFKLRIGLAIMLCALAGIAVTPGPALAGWQVAVLALAVLLSSASAGAFNQYVERDLDACMKRTRLRPFVTGQFHPGSGWVAAIGLLLAGSVLIAALATNWIAALHVFLGAFVYGVVYTVWLKRRSWTNIVVGGLAGSFAVLAGAAAVDPALAPVPLILALVLFLWTPPHFWSLATALHRDYAAAGVPMLPVVIGDAAAARVILGHTVALSLLALAPFWLGMGWLYLAGALAGGVYFTWRSVELMRTPGPATARRNFAASLVQLDLLLGAAILDRSCSAQSDEACHMLRFHAGLLLLLALTAGPAWPKAVLDEAEALRIGQAAIGRQLTDHTFVDAAQATDPSRRLSRQAAGAQLRLHQLLVGLPDHRPDPGRRRGSGAASARRGQLRGRDHRLRHHATTRPSACARSRARKGSIGRTGGS